MITMNIQNKDINTVYGNIKTILEKARATAYRAVNFTMVSAYWQIGKVIIRRRAERNEKSRIWCCFD